MGPQKTPWTRVRALGWGDEEVGCLHDNVLQLHKAARNKAPLPYLALDLQEDARARLSKVLDEERSENPEHIVDDKTLGRYLALCHPELHRRITTEFHASMEQLFHIPKEGLRPHIPTKHIQDLVPSNLVERVQSNILDVLLVRIRIAIEEAWRNHLEHGIHYHPGIPVHALARVKGPLWQMTSWDGGPGFDVTKVADCLSPENLEMPNGRGLMLMEAFANARVRFRGRGYSMHANLQTLAQSTPLETQVCQAMEHIASEDAQQPPVSVEDFSASTT